MQAKPKVVAFAIRPTTAVFVDDDKQYLKTLSNYLTRLGISHLMFSDPKRAIEYLKQTSKEQDWLRHWAQSSGNDNSERGTIEQRKIKLPIDQLIGQSKNSNRFQEVSCACFDHSMPKKTGLEAIENLAEYPFIKAMLTGQIPYGDAIDKLNEETFDVFVSKHDEDAIGNIARLIERARHVYFKRDVEKIAEQNERLRRILPNKEFIAFFDKFVSEHNYCESYLIEEFGSFALFDKNGNAAILAVLHDDDIEAYYQMAMKSDKKPDGDVLKLLKERKAFPFFYGQDIAKIEPKDWGSYLVPATQIDGAKIYYSVVEDVKKYGIDTDSITSYAEFLAKQDPFEFI